jgi:hypothetical protein
MNYIKSINNNRLKTFSLFLLFNLLIGLNQTMAQNKPQNVYSNAILIPSQPSGLLGSEIIPLASKTDAQGNTYVIGSFKGTVDLDPGVGVVSATSTNSGGSPANNYQATYLVKFNKYGEYVWSKSFTSAAGSQNWPKGIDFTAQGKIFVTGFFNNSITIGTTSINGIVSSRAPYCAYMIQFNTDGTIHSSAKLQGAVVFSPSLANYLYTNIEMHATKIDEDGNIIVAGVVSGDAGGNGVDLELKTSTVVSYIRGDYFILKYDTGYNLLSSKKITVSNGSTLRVDQIVNKNDTIFLQGYSDQPNVNFNGTASPGAIPANNGNYFTTAYTSNTLACIWAFKQGVDKQRIRVNPTGGLAYAWQVNGLTFDIDPTPNTVLVNGGPFTNIFMAHFDTKTGTLITTTAKSPRRISDTLINTSLMLGDFDFMSNGGFYLNGNFNSGINNIDMDPGPGVYHISSKQNSTADCFIAKYNANFSINFAHEFVYSADYYELMTGIESVDTSTFVITARYTGNGLNLDPKKIAPNLSLGSFNAGIYAKFTGGLNSINVNVSGADTVEFCKLSTTVTATSSNNNYTYIWYKNGAVLPAETTATINRTDAGTYQCLVRNNLSQQWGKKILFNILTNYALNFNYPLDGSPNNSMGLNNHGVPTAITYGTDRYGRANSAAKFDGSTSEIVVTGAGINTTNSGVSVWFKRANSNRKAMSLISFQVATPGSWNPILYLDSTGRLSGHISSGSGTAIYSSGIVLDTNWHHAAWTYDATKGKQLIFLDGVEVGSRVSGTLVTSGSNLIKIGNGYLTTALANVGATSNNNYFEGSIDGVKISTVLKPGNVIQQINEIVVTGKSPIVTSGFNTLVCAGFPLTTTILTGNSNLRFEWYYGNEIIQASDTNFAGVGTNSFTIKNMPVGNLSGHYAHIYDNFCNASYYESFGLKGETTSAILSQPTNQTACIGGKAIFVTKVSAAKSFLWKKNGVNIPNSNNDTLYINNITSGDFTNYTCTVTSCSDSVVTTNSANLSQLQLAINTQPLSQAVCLGNSVKLKVVTNSSIATYQWKKNGVNIPNANADSLFISPVTANSLGAYTVFVGGCANSLNSDTAHLTQATSSALNIPQLRLHLKMQGNASDATGLNSTSTIGTVNYVNDRNNASASAADFSAGYMNAAHSSNLAFTGTISISFWLNPKSHNGCRFIDKSAGNTNNFFVDQTGTFFRAFVAQKSVLVSELPPLNTWTHISVTYNAAGSLKVYYNGILKGTTAGANFNLTSNNNPLFIGAVQGGSCAADARMDDVRIYGIELSNAEINTIMNAVEVTYISPAQTICQGNNFTTQVTAINSAFQWYKNGVIIPGATSSSYTKTNAAPSDSGTYSCEVFSSNCLKQTVSTGKITINPIATILSEPTHASACANGNVQLSVVAIGSGLTYSWLKNGVVMSNGGNIAGATTNTLSISFMSTNEVAAYRCVVSNSCGTDTSMVANVSLNTGLQITQQPTSVAGCQNSSAQFIVKSNVQNATYTWRKNGVAIANSNNDTLTLSNITSTNAGNYQVFLTSSCGNDSSAIVSLSVNTNTQITTQPIGKNICGNAGFTLSTVASGANLSYQWKRNGVNIANETNSTYSKSTSSVSDTGNYTVDVNGTCGNLTSNIARINLANPISISTQPDTLITACIAEMGLVSRVNATGSILGYQWFLNNNAIANNANRSGATTNQLTFNGNSLAPGNLTCKIYGACDTLTTKTVVLSYYADPTIVSNPIAQSICVGSNATFKVKASNAVSYKWFVNGTLMSDIPNKIVGSATDSITALNVSSSDIGGNNVTVMVQAIGACPGKLAQSTNATLTLNTGISITNQSAANVSTCENSKLVLYVNTSSNANYVWKKNGTTIINQTNDTLQISSVATTDAGTYTCEATSACGNVSSNNMVVSVNPALAPSITQTGNTLSTQSFNTYEWRKNGVAIAGANSQNYNATENGLYSVYVTNTSGCNATSANFNFTFVGIHELSSLSHLFNVYPNPASDIITIKTDIKSSEEWTITLLDMAGAEVENTTMLNETTLPIQSLAKGVYFIKATHANGQQAIIKFIKD